MSTTRICCSRTECPDDAVWCGATTNWDNPYSEGSIEERVALYRDHVRNPDSRKAAWVRENLYLLRHRTLAVDTPLHLPSHVDVLRELADGPAGALAPHPYAELLPLLQGKDYDEFRDDIAVNGVRRTVVLFDGKILDGRNRWRAADETGQPCRYELFAGDDKAALDFVISENVRRRHLSESQRAMFAAAMATLPVGANQHTTAPDADADEPAQTCAASPGIPQAQAAALLNVSRRSVQHAAVVRDKGVPALKQAVERGDVSVSAAAAIATTLPPEQQEKVVRAAEKPLLAAASEVRAGRLEERRAARVRRMGELAAFDDAMPEGRRFPVVYVDPPRKYEQQPMGFTDRSIENHYETMTLEEMCALPVDRIAASAETGAVLYLMTTPSQSWHQDPALIAAWGSPLSEGGGGEWEFKAEYIWDKVELGMGHWDRCQHEKLLIFTRGDVPPPPPSARDRSIYPEKSEHHSRKPDYFRRLIERQFSDLPRIELFARVDEAHPRPPGWAVWGAEARMPPQDQNGMVKVDDTHVVAAAFVTPAERAEILARAADDVDPWDKLDIPKFLRREGDEPGEPADGGAP